MGGGGSSTESRTIRWRCSTTHFAMTPRPTATVPGVFATQGVVPVHRRRTGTTPSCSRRAVLDSVVRQSWHRARGGVPARYVARGTGSRDGSRIHVNRNPDAQQRENRVGVPEKGRREKKKRRNPIREFAEFSSTESRAARMRAPPGVSGPRSAAGGHPGAEPE